LRPCKVELETVIFRLHIDIIDQKIWIQQDGTETGIANELVNLGISPML